MASTAKVYRITAVGLILIAIMMLGACQKSSKPAEITNEKEMTGQQEETGVIELTPVQVFRDEKNDLILNMTCDELIQRWNTVCRENDLDSSLPDDEEMESYVTDQSIHSDQKTRVYIYMPGDDEHFYPIMAIYTSEKDGRLIQINISYNEHDYRENTWKIHEEMCFTALRTLMPDLSIDTLEKLCHEVYEEAADNMFPHEQGYRHGAVPAVLFHHRGIGVYPYFASGSRDFFCMIPVDEKSLSEFADSGTRVQEIE